jgi:hypothetical protein
MVVDQPALLEVFPVDYYRFRFEDHLRLLGEPFAIETVPSLGCLID